MPLHLPRGAILCAALALGFIGLLGLGPRARGAADHTPPPPQWGTDIRVNPVSHVTPSVQRNFAFAVNPAQPQEVIAGYDSPNGVLTDSAYARSTDGGQTWAAAWFFGPWLGNAEPTGSTSVGADAHGVLYYTTQILGDNGYGYVVLTTTTGQPWSTPQPLVLTGPGEYYDQGHLAVDPRAAGPDAGSLYFVARYFGNDALGLVLRTSRDGGQTWSAAVPVSGPDHPYSNGPSIAVARDGTLYVAFAYLPNNYLGSDVSFYLNRSTDGGRTWSGDAALAPPVTKIGAIDGEGHELLLPSDDFQHGVSVFTVPFLAVAPDDSRTVYAVWNDGRWDASFTLFGHAGRHGDIAFSRSTDGGTTWSAPVRVNDDPPGNGADQFLPALAVRDDGTIGVTWYDRRDDPAHYLYHLYYSQSTDGGVTWSANDRVSDQASDPLAVPTGEQNGLVGLYSALAFGPDYVLPGWIDTRAGYAQDFYTDRGTFAAAPSPTATATATATATPPPTPASPTAAPPASATPCAVHFADVPPDAYYAGPVGWLACRGILGGYADGTFRPANATTRAQLAKLVVLGFGWPAATPPTPTFADVPASHPFYSVIETAAARGVISGYSCGDPSEPCPGRYFRPAANVTRGQLAKILVGAGGWPPGAPSVPSFADVPASNPFYGYVETAVALNLLSGYTCGSDGEPCPGRYFRPAAGATRAQLSKILYNVLTAPRARQAGH
jgi:hypothetical protein